MAVTENLHTGNGSKTNYSFTFPYLKASDIKASINGTVTTAFTAGTPTATEIQFNTAPANNDAIRIYRDTDTDKLAATFFAGSSIKSQDLNENFQQNLYVTQEAKNNADAAWQSGDETIDSSETWQGDNTKVATTGAIDGRIDTKIDDALTNDVIGGQSITVTPNSPSTGRSTFSITAASVRGTELAADAVDGTKIADDSIDSEHIAAGSIDLEHMSANSVDSDQYVDGSIDLIHMSVNSIDSDQYVDGSIDHEHLSGDCIDGDNIQNDVVDSEHIAAGALDNEHYSTGSIDSTKLSSATVVTNAEQAAASGNDSSFFTTSASDARYFNVSTGDTIKDGDAFPDNDTTIATTAAINDRIIDLVDEVGGFTIIASEQTFPNVNPQGATGQAAVLSIKEATTNLVPTGTTLTVVNGNVANNANITITGVTSTIPSGFGFLIESTSTLHTYTFHRLVPKATQVTTVATNISNINAVANNETNINAAVSNASNINSAVSNASNISSVAGSITNVNAVAGNSTNINTVATNNSNINTVATNNTNVTTVATNIANVNTVATNITDVSSFKDLYQISTSAPSTDGGGNSLAAGDMWFDSSANKTLKVHNGSDFQSVSPSQSVLSDIAIVSGEVTFVEDLGSITDALTTGTGNNINTVATGINNINSLAGISAAITSVNNIGGNITTVAGIASNVTAVDGNSSNINAVVANATNINTVANNNGNITSVAQSLSGTQAYAVTVANVGGSNYFFIDSVQAPVLNLIRGFTYTFDVSNASNSNHPLRFKDGSGNSYTTGVTTSGTEGQAGATVTFEVASNAPTSLRYYCTVHGNGMGNTVATADSNIGKVAGSIDDINRYATQYTISNTAPSSPSSGDLWYDGISNILKFYNNSSFVGITPGLTDVVNDTTPELGGHLDCNDKNLTEVGTVSGNNLQIDFGTI